MALAKPAEKLSEEEYLRIERSAPYKSEFFDGEMFAMSGGTRWHSLISSNLIREMSSALKGRHCLVYDSNLRVKVEATGLMTYPDVIVACKEQRFVDNEMDTLLNPTLLVEVLSESTESYDRGKKFENYRQISALEEYLLVSQTEPKVEQYIRQNSGEWLLRFYSGLDSQMELSSLGISIQLSEVFANVTFEAVTLRNPTPSRNSAQQSSAGN